MPIPLLRVVPFEPNEARFLRPACIRRLVIASTKGLSAGYARSDSESPLAEGHHGHVVTNIALTNFRIVCLCYLDTVHGRTKTLVGHVAELVALGSQSCSSHLPVTLNMIRPLYVRTYSSHDCHDPSRALTQDAWPGEATRLSYARARAYRRTFDVATFSILRGVANVSQDYRKVFSTV